MKNNDNNETPAQNQDLESRLKSLKHTQPSEAQVNLWKTAVLDKVQTSAQHVPRLKPRHENSSVFTKYRFPLQLVAAMLVGFILGASLFKNLNSGVNQQEWVQTLSQDATFERTRTNLN